MESLKEKHDKVESIFAGLSWVSNSIIETPRYFSVVYDFAGRSRNNPKTILIFTLESWYNRFNIDRGRINEEQLFVYIGNIMEIFYKQTKNFIEEYQFYDSNFRIILRPDMNSINNKYVEVYDIIYLSNIKFDYNPHIHKRIINRTMTRNFYL